MAHRRILSLWFPRLAAERVLRADRGRIERPFAIVAERNNTLTLASLSAEAEAEGAAEVEEEISFAAAGGSA